MKFLHSILIALTFLVISSSAHANNPTFHFQGLLDLRLANTDKQLGWLDRGLGKGRYGRDGSSINTDNANGGQGRTLFRLGEASLITQAIFNSSISALVHLKADSEQSKLIDLIEGYLHFQPESDSNTLLKTKVGVFFPPFSMENTGLAWTSPYSISNSAINSWIGEELKTVGAELTATHDYEYGLFTLSGSLFRANDPAGSLLAWRGWAVHDRKTGTQDQLPLSPLPSIEEGGSVAVQANRVEPLKEIDGRTGYYGQFKWEHTDTATLQLSYYDNRANEIKFDGNQYAWHTSFTSLGAQYTPGYRIELIAQYLNGRTIMGQQLDGSPFVDNKFEAAFLLLSKPWGKHRLSARYDRFKVNDIDSNFDDDNNENGWSALLAYSYRLRPQQRFMIELMQINSDRPARLYFDLEPNTRERLLQANYRLIF